MKAPGSNPLTPLLLFRGFEPEGSMQNGKMVDSNQLPSNWMSTMLPLRYQTVYKMIYRYCWNQNIFFCNTTGLGRLYQFVCYTILVGSHFSPKSNDDYLPWLLYKSSFYDCSAPFASDTDQDKNNLYSGFGSTDFADKDLNWC